MEYRKRLNPECCFRTPKGIKGTRQKVIVTHNPSEFDQAQELLVRFPNLGSDDIIIPGMANLSFNIELTNTNRTLVKNIGRAIVKKLAVKFEGNEIMSVDNFDVFDVLDLVENFSDKWLAFLWEQTVPHYWLTCFSIPTKMSFWINS